jgi:hypothetical protein
MNLKKTRVALTVLVLAGLTATTACQSIKSRFTRQALPDLGPPMPMTAQLEFDPSLSKAEVEYLDNCGMLHPLPLGSTVEDSLIQAAHQTFKDVSVHGGRAGESKPDVIVRLRMLKPSLKIDSDALYDRAPTELNLDAFAQFVDPSGNVIAERPLQVIRKKRVQLELSQRRCDYLLDPFVQDTTVLLASQFMQEARVLFDPNSRVAGASGAPAAPTAGRSDKRPSDSRTASATAGAAISFKATLLDENSNLILENGERIRIRVDVVNTGTQPVREAKIALAGPPALMGQFPATQLGPGTLDPGMTRSLEFVATLPQSLPAQQADFEVSVLSASGTILAAPQTLVATVQPSGINSGDVDRIPAATPGFHRAKHFLVSIGLSSYREPAIPARKFAGLDAEMIATYFQSLGGLPAANVRLLQDWKALRPDIEEAVLDWLPAKVTEDSLVVVYFAGQAILSPGGDIFLIPYDGNLGSRARLYPMKDLEGALSRLKTKSVLFIFDGAVLKGGTSGPSKQAPSMWGTDGGSVVRLVATTGFGKNLESDKMRHGLFTYYVLRALRGDADANRNGEVTVGELTGYVSEKVPAAAKTSFNQEQRPQIVGPLRLAEKMNDAVLTKPPSIMASERPGS